MFNFEGLTRKGRPEMRVRTESRRNPANSLFRHRNPTGCKDKLSMDIDMAVS
jgi:hypothetical protein